MALRTFGTLPREIRQQILKNTITPCSSNDPVSWSQAEASQESTVKQWTLTLKLVNKDMEGDMRWVQKEWMERLVREREERYRGWWGGLERFMGDHMRRAHD
ncbi:hypothetical protein E2P81_ATG09114 [Venturia nashicola]|uniref:Uncharacterized protein n=1 Tax=Venturia nashicola TaxID=86259 RepID=A0A4Z1NU27_9PEZI|nr:hypothetical protein E6O75_ATG09314 [Venturia nashicola]TLD20044.1 hypothetical protein E2P81_ATG09114 [Venturia nashicola]